MHLAFDLPRVHRPAAILHGDDTLDADNPGLRIDRDFGELHTAEIALRRHLGLTVPGGPRLAARVQTGAAGEGGLLTDATFTWSGRAYAVHVRSTHSEPVTLTCRAVRDQVALQHEILTIDEV